MKVGGLRRATRLAVMALAACGVLALSLVTVPVTSALASVPGPVGGWIACKTNSNGSCSDQTDAVNFEYFDPNGRALQDLLQGLKNAGWVTDTCTDSSVKFNAGGWPARRSPSATLTNVRGGGPNNCLFSGTRDHARLWPNTANTVVFVAASDEALCLKGHCVTSFNGGRDQLAKALNGKLPGAPAWMTTWGTSKRYSGGNLPSSGPGQVPYDGNVTVAAKTYPVADAPNGPAFKSLWQAYGAVIGAAGYPLAPPSGVSGGQVQPFSGLSEYWSAGTGTHEVNGRILAEYQRIGGPKALGFPVTNEQPSAGGGHESEFAGANCGSMTTGSAILDTPATNAHEMHGCIYVAYVQRFGGPGGQFAYPWTDEQEAPGGAGRVNYMSGQECSSGQAEPHSAVYYGNQTGQVWGVKGCIFRAYQSVGGPSDAGLGYPTSLEYGAAGGTVQAFQHGYILWANGKATIYPNSTPPGNCTNYGPSTITGPNACGGTFSTHSVWFSGHGVGLFGQEIWTYANGTVKDSTATYQLSGLSTSRVSQLQAYIPNNYSDASHAHYHFCTPGGGCADGYVNQNDYTNQWAPIGLVCTTDGTATVVLADDGGNKYPVIVGADAVRAVPIARQCTLNTSTSAHRITK